MFSSMKNILLLGASGSIGEQTIDIINKYPKEFTLVGFSVGKRTKKIESLIKKHKEVKYIYLIDDTLKEELAKKYPNIHFYSQRMA